SSARRGRPAVITVRAACISATCCSSERTPRALPDISDPIATMQTATTASATSTSMIVKPASRRSVDDVLARNNLDPSGQPVDTNFITGIEARQRDRAATGGTVGEEADGRQRRLLPAGLRQQGVEADIIGDADCCPRCTGMNHAIAGVDQRCDAGVA